jgi:hypothetical protein
MPQITAQQRIKLFSEIMKGTLEQVAKVFFKIPEMERCIKGIFLKRIDEQCKSLCAIKKQPSVLRTPREQHKELSSTFQWNTILHEMKTRVPDLLDVLTTVSGPVREEKDSKKVPRVAMAYSILMNTRNRHLTLVQKIIGVVLCAGHVTKKVNMS